MKPMMTARRTRASEPNTIAGTEDISILTLSEVRSRLERNERVLNTALFSSSPTSPAAFPAQAPAAAAAIPGPGQSTSTPNSAVFGTSPTSPFLRSAMSRSNGQTSPSPVQPSGDPLRDRLLAARQALLAREQELLLEEGMDGMEVSENAGLGSPSAHAESSHAARRRSSGMSGLANGASQARSGKQRAMEAIQAGEMVAGGNANGRMLPIAQTMAFAEREFDSAAAQRIAGMSIQSDSTPNRTPTKRKPKARPGQYDPTDEIARAQANARMAAFMSYKGGRRSGRAANGGADGTGAGGGDDDDDDDDDDGFFDDDSDGVEGEYDGEDDRFELGPQGREPYRVEPGTAEEVDEMGEDDEGWKEGNDEYLDRVR